MRSPHLLVTTTLLTAGALLVPAQAASAGQSHSRDHGARSAPAPTVRSDQVVAPFNLELTRGKVLLADGGLDLVGALRRDGSIATIAADQPGASGIATAGKRLAFTTTVTDYETFENSASGLNIWGPHRKKVYADTHAYEARYNPDRINSYGVKHPSACVSDALTSAGLPVSYRGLVDSHAYSVAAYRGGWIVADAGANALFRIDNKGRIATLAVLPPQPAKITADAAAAFDLPDCVIGVTYAFEPVPTDVEVGRDGSLYVTTLPGGPESAALGARGAVWRVNPWTGKATRIAGGLLGATNLAIGERGEIYVSELFGGRISVVRHGTVRPYVSLPGVVAVESDGRGRLWAATMANEDPAAPGTIVQITGGRCHHRADVPA